MVMEKPQWVPVMGRWAILKASRIESKDNPLRWFHRVGHMVGMRRAPQYISGSISQQSGISSIFLEIRRWNYIYHYIELLIISSGNIEEIYWITEIYFYALISEESLFWLSMETNMSISDYFFSKYWGNILNYGNIFSCTYFSMGHHFQPPFIFDSYLISGDLEYKKFSDS